MTFIQLDDHYYQHSKVCKATRDAAWFNVCAMCYAHQLQTDGFISNHVIYQLWHSAGFEPMLDDPSPDELVRRLLDAGLWEQADDGYTIHDYLDYQTSRDGIAEMREKKSLAGKAGAQKRWHNGTPIAPCHIAGMAEGSTTRKPGIANDSQTQTQTQTQTETQKGRVQPSAARDKRAPATPTATAVLGDWFAAEYERTQGRQCIRAYAKDGAGLKRLLAQGLAADYLQQLMTYYLEDNTDAWWEDHGHDLGTFCAQVQTVMARFDKRESHQERETGYERRAEARAFHAEDLPQTTDADRAAALATIATVKAAFAARKMPEEAQR